MSRRVNARVVVLLSVSASALAVPAIVQASSGGAGLGGGGGSGSGTRTQAPRSGKVQAADVPVSVSGNGITVRTRESAILRRPLKFTGNIGSAGAGDVVEIQRRGRETGYRWANTAHGTASSSGHFKAVWPTNHIGQFDIRAVIMSGRTPRAASASPSLSITVFRPAIATTYGPGFWGSQTACGETLHHATLGVANRTLKCGTKVALYYGGKELVVPVIDRGPYANGADWDLTSATARALNIPGTVTIGAVSLPKSH